MAVLLYACYPDSMFFFNFKVNLHHFVNPEETCHYLLITAAMLGLINQVKPAANFDFSQAITIINYTLLSSSSSSSSCSPLPSSPPPPPPPPTSSSASSSLLVIYELFFFSAFQESLCTLPSCQYIPSSRHQ